MYKREALYIINRDIQQNHLTEVGYYTDGRTFINVTARSPNNVYYRYIYDALSDQVNKYEMQVALSTRQFINHVKGEKNNGKKN